MNNLSTSESLVNNFLSFLLKNIPDESSLFNLDFELHFPENLNNKIGFEHTYQWFQDLFVKPGIRNKHFKWLIFSNFLIQLSQQFIKKQSLRVNHRKLNLHWPTDTMIPILHKQGFIQIRKGFFDSANETQQFNRLTRIYPTEKLIKEIYPMMFGMQIAMKNYPFMYKKAVTKNNKRFWEIDPKKSANPPSYIKKSKRLLEDLSVFNKGQLIFITDAMPSMLYRVFNGGWKKNGRIYVFDDQLFGRRFIKDEERDSKTITDIEPVKASYQFLSKQNRQNIMIGGEENAEVDFVGMHPRMLYSKVDIQYDDDPYLVIVEDLNLRKFAKKVIYCALYSTNPKTMINAIQYQINMSELNVKEKLRKQNLNTASKILDKMSKVHAPISSFFGTDISLDLCFIESEIILDVAKVLMEYDINFMLIHDSICVPKDNKTFVKDLMLEMYKKHTGFNAQVKIGD